MIDLHEALLARRYAQAYADYLGDQFSPHDYTAYQRMYNFLFHHKQALFYLQLETIRDELKTGTIKRIAQRHGITNLDKLIDLLQKQRRLAMIGKVLRALIDEYRQRAGLVAWTIASSCKLSAEQEKSIITFLGQTTDKKIEAHFKIDPTLIAGLSMHSATLRWEYSVRKQLQKIMHIKGISWT